jgi:hypothetical protein
MTGVPNHGGYPRGLACYDPSVYSYGGLEGYEGAGGLNPYIKQNNLQNVIQQYWELLAKRYAEVPAKFLSFNLEVEIGLDDEKEFVDTYLPIAEAIRSYNNDRVVFCYANGNKVLDGLAAYGYPLAYSFYAPSKLTLSGESEDYPYYDAKWPTYNLNGVLVGSEEESQSTLQLTLNSDMASVKIHARNTDGEAPINVKADSKKLSMTKTEDDNGWYFLESELPSDTSELKLSVNGDCAVEFDAIFLTKPDGSEISINPYQFDYPTQEEMTVITVAEDGSITSNQKLNFETLINEQDNLGEYIKIADKYKVGIIVSEWGIAANMIDEDTETLYNYMKEMDEGFDALGITAASTNAPDLSTRSVILTKRCATRLYESQGSMDFNRYKALDYSSKYYIDTYLAELLYKH